jgi:hypothetical protein
MRSPGVLSHVAKPGASSIAQKGAAAVASSNDTLRLRRSAAMLVVFGFTWMGWGLGSSQWGRSQWPLWLIIYVLTGVLGGWIAFESRRAVTSTRRDKAGELDRQKRLWTDMRGTLRFEMLGCLLVVLLSALFRRWEFLAIGISCVVGLHLLPLAAIFKNRAFAATGASIMLLNAFELFSLPHSKLTLSTGISTGVALWSLAILEVYRLRQMGVGLSVIP